MPNKLSIEQVKEIVESRGGELLSDYKNSSTPILVKTSDGEIETRYLNNVKSSKKLISKKNQLKSLSDKSRLTIKKVKCIVESKGAELLSTEYKNDASPLLIKFRDGEIEERCLISIKHSKKLISKKEVIKNRANKKRLSLNEVKNIIEDMGGKLLSTEYKGLYEPILIETIDGKIENRKLSSIKKSKKLYSKEYSQNKRFKDQLLPITEVEKRIKERGGKLLQESRYNGNHKPLLIETTDGVTEERLLSNIEKVTWLVSKGSCFEQEIFNFIQDQYEGEILKHDRKLIYPNEVDIVIPDKKLTIECNGIYWHSDKYKHKKYHLNKTLLVNDVGYNLLHISDSDWILKQDIVKNIIQKKLDITTPIYARKCKIKKLSINKTKEFLKDNHLQGCTSASIKYGLFHNDELISVATFSKPRFNKEWDYELCRFANKLGITVIGGFGKLLTHFIKNKNPKSIISYCDISYFSGNMYESNNFKWIKRSAPNYKYFHPNSLKLHSRNKFQKHKLPKLLENFDPNLSEYENMTNNGFFRIWDCGNDVYLWKNE